MLEATERVNGSHERDAREEELAGMLVRSFPAPDFTGEHGRRIRELIARVEKQAEAGRAAIDAIINLKETMMNGEANG